MTATADMKQAIELVLERTMTNTSLVRIGTAAGATDPYATIEKGIVVVSDPDNLTNEEKAMVIRATTKLFWQSLLGETSDKKSDESAAGVRASNRAAAIADME